MEIKDLIKNKRNERNLTMKELSDLVGVSEGTISRWESGDIENMRRDKIYALSKVLNISPNILMGWEEIKETDIVLSDDEKRLIEAYRESPEGRREAVRTLLNI